MTAGTPQPGAKASVGKPAGLFAGIALFDASRPTYEAAVRASLGFLVPVLTLYFIDRMDLGVYAAMTSFTAFYGRREPYRTRWLSVATVGAVQVLCVLLGALISSAGAPLWLLMVSAAGVTLITLPLSFGMQLIPKGSMFFLFALLACANAPVPPEGLPIVAITALATAGFSWCVAMSGRLLRAVPAIAIRLQPLPHEPVRSVSNALAAEVRSLTIAAIIGMTAAALIAWSLNLASHQYWAVITVAAIFATPTAMRSFERTLHRVAGTLAGVGLAAALFSGNPPTLYVIIVCTVCQFILEVVVGRHYGVALTFITPVAIGASNLRLTTDWETLFVDRSRETLLGAACAVVIIIAVRWQLQRTGKLTSAA